MFFFIIPFMKVSYSTTTTTTSVAALEAAEAQRSD